ncbi:MAG: flagellar motor protein MotB [Haliscomenobacteraceae bacterium CHB4]|nr:flagellar motor protein MotB [Haliscomenobacteraceae bacterium CHB4]
MTALIILLCVFLISIVLVQIGKVTELTAQIKGEREVFRDNSKWNGWLSVGFLVFFLVGVFVSAWGYKNEMMGYGPHESASAHGSMLDDMFNITLVLTGIVFVITHIALFWFAYKYRWQEGRKAQFIAHDNRLELIWTAVPAVVMTILVVRGLNAWNTVMADVKPDEDYMEIEATGQQFNWIIRYPGPDGKLGTRNFKLTTANNQLGMDFTDPKTWDDVLPGQELYLPVGKKVRVRIIAKDVLHNFYLPHFRVKMDAVPGMPTYFVFTPIKTTAEYRNELRKYDDFNVPADPADPTGPKRWEKFEYELACAELCGKGHYSMKRIFKVVTQEEYDAWYRKQESFYMTQIRNKDDDPNKGKVLDVEVRQRAKEFSESVKRALESAHASDKTLALKYVNFETGSANLTADSRYELDNLVTGMNAYPNMVIEVAGHTDNVGDPASNMTLSQARAASVVKYLTDRGISESRLQARGYGDTKPLAPNDSDENRAKNRRTEFTILTPNI